MSWGCQWLQRPYFPQRRICLLVEQILFWKLDNWHRPWECTHAVFASSYGPSLDLSVSLLFYKHMQLQHHLTFFICQITPVHRYKGVLKVQLLRIALGCLMGLVSPFFQTCLEWQLSNNYYHNSGFVLVRNYLQKHVCTRMKHSLDLLLYNGIFIPFPYHARGVGIWLGPNSFGSAWPFCRRC